MISCWINGSEVILDKDLVGFVVKSKLGRDKNKLYIVSNVIDDYSVTLIDGKKFDFNDRWSMLAEADVNLEFYETNAAISGKGFSISPQVGVELGYDEMIFVRGGLNNWQKVEQFNGKEKSQIQPNVGVGFKYKGISIDYALTNFGDSGLGLYSNIFSVRFEMDKWR